MRPRDGEGRPRQETPRHHVDLDHRTVARQRVQSIDRRCRIARMADEVMPMALYYDPRTPRPIPLGRFLAEGWWAA